MGFLTLLVFSSPRAVAAGESLEKGIQLLTSEILDQSLQEQQRPVGRMGFPDDSLAVQELKALAKERQGLMKALLREGPKGVRKVLEMVRENKMQNRIPLTLHRHLDPWLEKEVRRKGRLEVFVAEDFGPEGVLTLAEFRYFLKEAGSTSELFFSTETQRGLISGDKIQVSGIQIGDALVPAEGEGTEEGGGGGLLVVSEAPLDTLGEQRVLAILVDFRDKKENPEVTPSAVEEVIFRRVNEWYQENSFHQSPSTGTWFTGKVVGWYELPLRVGNTCPDADVLMAEAIRAADAADSTLNLGSYDRVLVGFPGLPCSSGGNGWAGRGTVGKVSASTPDGTILVSQAWINGWGIPPFNRVTKVVTHELGHNQGLWHAHHLDCGIKAVPDLLPVMCKPPVFYGDFCCTDSEYGDLYSVMGSSQTGHFGAVQKAQIGWIPPQNVVTLRPGTTGSVTSRTSHTIDLLERPSSRPQVLKILKEVDGETGRSSWYSVEYRRPVDADGSLAYPNPLPNPPSAAPHPFTVYNIDGAMMILAREVGLNRLEPSLLDMTPESRPDGWAYDFYDATLTVGHPPFQDPSGITISTTGVNDTSLSVSVTIPPDTMGPQLRIVQPENRVVSGRLVRLQADVVDNASRITEVEFYKDGNLVAKRPTTPSLWLEWDTTLEQNGTSHTWILRAVDERGNPGASEPVTFTVDNSLPSVELIAPQGSGPFQGVLPVWVKVSAGPSRWPVRAVEFSIDGRAIFQTATAMANDPSVFEFLWDTRRHPNGPHTVQTRVSMFDFTTAESISMEVMINNPAPVVRISYPAQGQILKEVVTVSAELLDPSLASRISRLVLMVDGNARVSDQQAPYAFTWDTFPPEKNGVHDLFVQADLTDGSTGHSAPITVTVNNFILMAKILEPMNQAPVRGMATVKADLTNNGFAPVVSVVKLLVNQEPSLILRPPFMRPFTFQWDTTALEDGLYTLQVEVNLLNRNFGYSEPIQVFVANYNELPRANAGADQQVRSGQRVVLDGSASFDSEQEPLVYSWRQMDGLPAVSLVNASTEHPTFTAPPVTVSTPLTFELTVTDSVRNTGRDTVVITVLPGVNQQPVAQGGTLFIQEDQSVPVTLRATDPEGGPLIYLIVTSPTLGTLTGTGPNVTYKPDANVFGVDRFTFQVRDVEGALSNIATVRIAISPLNDPPVLTPTGSKSVAEGEPLEFDVIAIDVDGDPLTYSASGLPVNAGFDPVRHHFNWTPDFAQGREDPYAVTFNVSDGKGGEASEIVSITVTDVNRPPVVQAAVRPAVATDGQIVTLDGAGSLDPDNDPVTYDWSQRAGPPVDLLSPTGVRASFVAPAVSTATVLTFELIVRDGRQGSGSSIVGVTISPRGDADGDGRLTHVDVATLLKGLAGIGSARVPASTDPRFPAWDFNRDGQVNQEDATGPTGLMQRLLGRNP